MKVWAANAVAVIHAYDPEMVVLSGGVISSGGHILPFVQEYVKEHAWTSWGHLRVCAAMLGGNSVLFGAAPLLREHLVN